MTSKIIITGLGPANLNQITLETWEELHKEYKIILRTDVHPAAKQLRAENINFTSCDFLYASDEDFQQVYKNITEYLLSEAKKLTDNAILYCVPGHPLVAEETVQRLLKQGPVQGVEIKILTSMSFLDTVFTALSIDPTQAGFAVLDSLNLPSRLPFECDCLYTQVYNRFVVSDLKLDLLEYYPADHIVTIIYHAGAERQKIQQLELAKVDFEDYFDHLTSVYVPKLLKQNMCSYPLDPLTQVFDRLLAPNGCPWDRQQTHATLKQYFLEETYEVLEAIDLEDMDLLQEELGDVLMQIVFHGALAKSRGDFDYNDIINGITEKLIRRHPHVFGQENVKKTNEVEVIWDRVKATEKKGSKLNKNLYSGLPALLMAAEFHKLKKKQTGKEKTKAIASEELNFEWQKLQQALIKNELSEANLGDFLLTLTGLCQAYNFSAEVALISTIMKMNHK